MPHRDRGFVCCECMCYPPSHWPLPQCSPAHCAWPPGRRTHHICRSSTTRLRLCLSVCALTPLILGHCKRCQRAGQQGFYSGGQLPAPPPSTGLCPQRPDPCTPGLRHKHRTPLCSPSVLGTLTLPFQECAPSFSLLPQIFTEYLLCARQDG